MQRREARMDILRLSNLVFGPEWSVFKEYLLVEKEKMVNALILATTQEESMRFRGEIRRLESLLKLPEALQNTRKASR